MKKFLMFLLVSVLAMSFLAATISVAYAKTAKIKITSTAFKNNKKMPSIHAYGDESNFSPQLAWKTSSKDVKSYALIMYDKHKIAKKWVHWCVTNIPADVISFEQGTSGNLPGGIELPNTYGFTGYGGPNPPAGSGVHKYVFWIVGLNTDEQLNPTATVDLGDGYTVEACTLKAFKKAIKGKVVAQGKITGKYEIK